NNYGDKTLMRNIVANEISRTVGMPYTPFCRAVDVVLNGEYRGCYQLMDKIERGKNRVEIEELAPASNTEPEITGGYLMEVDAYYFDEPCYFTTNKGLAVTLHEPDADSISLAQKAYIKRYFNTLETSLYGGNFMSPNTGYRRFFDTQTFLKHFIVGETAGNTDTYWSVYMYKPRGGKVFTGPVWDFDIAFNNDQRTYPVQNINGFVCFSGMASFADGMYEFLNRIINRDTSAQVELSELWTWARWHGLTEDRLCSYVDSVAAALQESQRLNFLRWSIMNQQVHENPSCAGSYDGEVARLKTYLRERLPQLDSFIGLASAVDLAEPGGAAAPYEVFDLDGRPVAVASDVSRLPAFLPKGVYIVRHGRSSRKVVVR
ncbi:MAG: CotH kinase family protein, partial [Bacteroidaceae bacterium]|nr:CotH kinase family protein [Bacteroidaceae bacterium]